MAKSKAAKAGGAAYAAKNSPYVQRVIEDDELRDNIRVAFDSARDAYGRLSNGKAPTKALLDDKKLHKDLRKSADALRDATEALREGKKKKRRLGIGRLLLLTIVGAAVAIAVSEDVRNKVLDALFGAEEEFDYTSTTSPASAPPAPAPSGSS
jgi:hypothetical protein